MGTNSIGWYPKAYDIAVTVSQAISGSSTLLYAVNIPIIASAASGVISTATTVTASSGYQGLHWKARPTSTTGRSGGVSIASYPSIMDDSRASISSDQILGPSISLTKVYIQNSNLRIIFELKNGSVSSQTAAFRIMGTAYP